MRDAVHPGPEVLHPGSLLTRPSLWSIASGRRGVNSLHRENPPGASPSDPAACVFLDNTIFAPRELEFDYWKTWGSCPRAVRMLKTNHKEGPATARTKGRDAV